MKDRNRSANQAEEERWYFTQLVRIAGLPADLSTLVQNPPPAPDLHCLVGGQSRWFELCAVTDSTMEEKHGRGTRSAGGTLGYSNYRVSPEQVVALIRRKQSKSYLPAATDLLVHSQVTPLEDLWILDDGILDESIQPVVNSSPFDCVWLLDAYEAGHMRFRAWSRTRNA